MQRCCFCLCSPVFGTDGSATPAAALPLQSCSEPILHLAAHHHHGHPTAATPQQGTQAQESSRCLLRWPWHGAAVQHIPLKTSLKPHNLPQILVIYRTASTEGSPVLVPFTREETRGAEGDGQLLAVTWAGKLFPGGGKTSCRG